MKIPFFQVDAFVTGHPFSGNPAGVCLLPGPKDEKWMQDLAREVNQSETAFLHPEKDGYRLRWFTPKVEVALCGHATLASAHILWEEGFLKKNEEARFWTQSGLLKATQKDGPIELDFPSKPVSPSAKMEGLEEALGVPVVSLAQNGPTFLAELRSAEVVRQLKPDMSKLETLQERLRGVIVTAASDEPAYDFLSRFFAPAWGVPEDPVTGSAHCLLGPFWQDRLHKNPLTAFQASARGGELLVRCEGDRVHLVGKAKTVIRGEIS